MENELEKFYEESNRKKDIKLLVDFEQSKIDPNINNQVQIESIKYKKKQIKKGGIVNLKDRNKKDTNSLF
jgi:hypothetical protein